MVVSGVFSLRVDAVTEPFNEQSLRWNSTVVRGASRRFVVVNAAGYIVNRPKKEVPCEIQNGGGRAPVRALPAAVPGDRRTESSGAAVYSPFDGVHKPYWP